MKKYLFLVLFFIVFSSNGYGAYYSGNELLSHCEEENFATKGICGGYIAAVADATTDLIDGLQGRYYFQVVRLDGNYEHVEAKSNIVKVDF